jgi:RecG-like helicase
MKTIYRFSMLLALAIFAFAVLRMASINEVPENQLDNSIKKDRQDEMIERSKEAVEDSNKTFFKDFF